MTRERPIAQRVTVRRHCATCEFVTVRVDGTVIATMHDRRSARRVQRALLAWADKIAHDRTAATALEPGR